MTNITKSGYVASIPTLNNPKGVSTVTRSVSLESRFVKNEPIEDAFTALRRTEKEVLRTIPTVDSVTVSVVSVGEIQTKQDNISSPPLFVTQLKSSTPGMKIKTGGILLGDDFNKADVRNNTAKTFELISGEDPTLKDSGLLLAVKEGSIEGIKKLIEGGANVNYKENEDGKNVLHYAIQLWQPSIVESLIKNGADMSTVITEGPFKDYTPMEYAVQLLEIQSYVPKLKEDVLKAIKEYTDAKFSSGEFNGSTEIADNAKKAIAVIKKEWKNIQEIAPEIKDLTESSSVPEMLRTIKEKLEKLEKLELKKPEQEENYKTIISELIKSGKFGLTRLLKGCLSGSFPGLLFINQHQEIIGSGQEALSVKVKYPDDSQSGSAWVKFLMHGLDPSFKNEKETPNELKKLYLSLVRLDKPDGPQGVGSTVNVGLLCNQLVKNLFPIIKPPLIDPKESDLIVNAREVCDKFCKELNYEENLSSEKGVADVSKENPGPISIECSFTGLIDFRAHKFSIREVYLKESEVYKVTIFNRGGGAKRMI